MLNIYLDHAASSPPDPRVTAAMSACSGICGNPSAQHFAGREARACIERSRRKLAAVLDRSEREVYFTSGATEGNNLVIRSAVHRAMKEGKPHFITSVTEHASVYEVFRRLEREGHQVSYIDPGAKGYVSLEDVRSALRPDTGFVSIQHVNSETGAVQPLAAIAELLHERRIFFHTDAAQGFARLPLPTAVESPEAVTVTAHKIGGPKGIGAVFYAGRPEALFSGGRQERGARPGTENILGIVGLAAAAEFAAAERAESMMKLCSKRRFLLDALTQAKLSYEVHEAPENYPGILNIRIIGRSAEILLIRLDRLGIAVSAGSACAAGSLKPSRVLSSLCGADSPAVRESLRISFSASTSEGDLRCFVRALKRIVKG